MIIFVSQNNMIRIFQNVKNLILSCLLIFDCIIIDLYYLIELFTFE